MSSVDPLPGVENVRAFTLIDRYSGDAIGTGTVYHWLYALDGPHAGKFVHWAQNPETEEYYAVWSSQLSAGLIAAVCVWQSGGLWTATVPADAWLDGVSYVEGIYDTDNNGLKTSRQIRCTGAAAPGTVLWTICVQDDAGNVLDGVACWLTSDAAGETVVSTIEHTDSAGLASFAIAAGTYYLWRQRAGMTFPNPVTVTVS